MFSSCSREKCALLCPEECENKMFPLRKLNALIQPVGGNLVDPVMDLTWPSLVKAAGSNSTAVFNDWGKVGKSCLDLIVRKLVVMHCHFKHYE